MMSIRKDTLYILYRGTPDCRVVNILLNPYHQAESCILSFKSQVFRDKEELMQKAYDVMERLGYTNSLFMSLEDFNLGVELCCNISDLVGLFHNNGTSLDLSPEDRPSFLKKLLNFRQ